MLTSSNTVQLCLIFHSLVSSHVEPVRFLLLSNGAFLTSSDNKKLSGALKGLRSTDSSCYFIVTKRHGVLVLELKEGAVEGRHKECAKKSKHTWNNFILSL